MHYCILKYFSLKMKAMNYIKINFFLISAFIFLFSIQDLNAQEQCNSCSGIGSQNCIRCSGEGQYSCDQCGGAGGRWVICNCNNGIVNMPDGTTQVCDYCKGEGRKWHSCYNPNCNNGTAFCHFCRGQGALVCPVCKGTGNR